MRPMLLALLVACGGGTKDPTDDPTAPATPTTDTADTGATAPSGWAPTSFTVRSQFAVDDGRLRTWFIDGTQYAPFVALELWGDAAPESEICTVFLVIDNPSEVRLEVWSWEDATEEAAGQAMQHLGFMVPDDARVETDGCDDVDRGRFGEPGETIASKLWGVGVGGLRVDVEARFEEEITEGFYADAYRAGQVVGGSWSSNVWEPAIWGSHIAVASELTPDGALELTAEGWPAEPMDSRDVLANPAGIPDAHYMLTGILLYDADAYLY